MQPQQSSIAQIALRSKLIRAVRDKLVFFLYPSLRLKDSFVRHSTEKHVHSGDLLLDVGCADRSIAGLVSSRGVRYFGVEYPVWQDLYSIVTVKERPDSWIDIMHSGLLSDKFDVIMMIDVLEHISNPDRALRECYRSLRDGGTIILLVPFFIELHGGTEGEEDFVRITPSGFDAFLERAGFVDINTEKLGHFGDALVSLTSGFFLRNYFASKGLASALYFIFAVISCLVLYPLRFVLNSTDLVQRNPTHIAAVARKKR